MVFQAHNFIWCFNHSNSLHVCTLHFAEHSHLRAVSHMLLACGRLSNTTEHHSVGVVAGDIIAPEIRCLCTSSYHNSVYTYYYNTRAYTPTE